MRIDELIGTIKTMLDAYTEGSIDRLFLVENEFVNTMTQRPKVSTLLPLVAEDNEDLKHHWDYIYEPDAKVVLDEAACAGTSSRSSTRAWSRMSPARWRHA